jgi:hypothetical protein
VYSIDGFADIFRCAEREFDMDAPDHENTVLVFDFASSVRSQSPIACVDLARFQRAPKGSQHSAGRRSDDVIDRSCVGFTEFGYVDAIMSCDFIMNAERHGLLFAGQLRDP